ncbi:MAG: glycosyltransferase family 2 protein [Cyanobacteria bacterium RM1_2_2]|nr:glycosyltransferase family 2 protein [Cyanobacteria bacterium RM1_2_2]
MLKVFTPASPEFSDVDVSVIIPTYNRTVMLRESLNSVFSQDFDGVVEVVVIDDNSKDETSKIICQEYPKVHLISLDSNVGAYAARNLGISKSKGEHIAFLDSDDLWKPDYLKTQLAALKGKDRHFVVSDLISWNTQTSREELRVQRPNLVKYQSPIHHLLAGGSFISSPSSAIFPKSLMDEIGLFSEERIASDTDLYIRCLLAGYSPIFTALPTVIKRKHGKDQLTDIRNFEARKKGRLERAKKYHPLVKKQFDIAPLQQIYAEIHAEFASRYLGNKWFLSWVNSSLASANHASPMYVLSNMGKDLKTFISVRARSISKSSKPINSVHGV